MVCRKGQSFTQKNCDVAEFIQGICHIQWTCFLFDTSWLAENDDFWKNQNCRVVELGDMSESVSFPAANVRMFFFMGKRTKTIACSVFEFDDLSIQL